MGMSDAKMRSLLDGYETKLNFIRKEFSIRPLDEIIAPGTDPSVGAKIVHAQGMIPKMRVFLYEGRREKAFRWLGFLQGVFWMLNLYTVEELANHSRPSKKDLEEQYKGHSFNQTNCTWCSVEEQHFSSRRTCKYEREYLEAPLDAFPIK